MNKSFNKVLKKILITVSFLAIFFTVQNAFAGSINDSKYGLTKKDVEKITQAAKAGDSNAQYKLAQWHSKERLIDGITIVYDAKKAHKWYLKAAKGGHVDAQYALGWRYAVGLADKKSKKESAYWYLKAAEQGHQEALYKAGSAYHLGKGFPVDLDKAIDLYEKAVEKGHGPAQRAIENIEEKMLAKTKKGKAPDESASWELPDSNTYSQKSIKSVDIEDMIKAVETKNEKLLEKTVRALENGIVSFVKQFEEIDLSNTKAYKLLSVAAEELEKLAKAGDAWAQGTLGTFYYHGRGVNKDLKKAFELQKQAAENGNAQAQYNISTSYYEGIGTEKDYKKAFEWAQKAAKKGKVRAHRVLAKMHYHGKGVSQNYKKAAKELEKAFEAGDPEALNDLSLMHFRGQGVPQDIDKAIELQKKAISLNKGQANEGLLSLYEATKGAEAGDPEAQYELAKILAYDFIVDSDLDKAIEWAEKSFDGGYKKAQRLITTLKTMKENSQNTSFDPEGGECARAF